jgi:hypothetical protein
MVSKNHIAVAKSESSINVCSMRDRLVGFLQTEVFRLFP